MKQPNHKAAKTVGYSLLSMALATATFIPAVAVAVDSGQDVLPSGDSPKKSDSQEPGTAAKTPASKDETVYVHITADGSVKSEEVNATLKNPDGAEALSDASSLKDIKVEDGDGVYSGSPSDMVWSAGGQDVTYKGASDAEAPIDVRVTYKLDGKVVSPEEIAGKSGRVSVRYDYVNKSKTTVEVNGTKQEVYTPFVAVTAILLDSDVFSKVAVTNGKIVEDGNRTIVVGYAMPGLEESLDLSGEDVDIPGYFEFEADAKDFELKSALTMASPNLFDDFDLDIDVGELSETSSALRDAMGQIVSGSNELAEATAKIADASSAMASGTQALSSQTATLPDSTAQMAQGAQGVSGGVAQLYEAAKNLDSKLLAIIGTSGSGAQSSGLSGAVENVTLLKEQAKQLYESLSGKSADDAALEGQGAASDEHLSQLAAQVSNEASAYEANAQNVRNAADQTATSTSQAQSDVLAAQATVQSIDLSAIEDPAVRAQVQSQLDAASSDLAAASQSTQAAGDSAQSLQSMSSNVETSAAEEAVGAFAEAAGARSVSAQSEGQPVTKEQIEAAKRLYEGLTALEAGLKQSVQALSTLEQQALSNGMLAPSAFPAVVQGAAQLAQGAGQLSNSAPELVGGIGQLTTGSSELATALQALASGTKELASGLQQFNDQGIAEIANAIDNRLAKPLTRFDAVTQAGKNYQNFSGITPGTKGTVKFVFETDPISAS